MSRHLRTLMDFLRDDSGNMALTFSLALPAVIAAGAAGLEMSNANTTRTRLQGIADTASVAAARELRLGNATADAVIAVARANVAASMNGSKLDYAFNGAVSSDKRVVTVTLSASNPTGLAAAAGLVSPTVKATSAARVMGGSPVCAVALNGTDTGTIDMDKSARVQAPGCAVYSNSKSARGIDARDSAVLQSAFTCTSGGFSGGAGTFTPTPDVDCPVFPDPLAARPAPTVGPCESLNSNLQVTADSYLNPGVYCGGIRIEKNVVATLQPGIYVIKDGPLRLDKGGRIQGTGVTLYFTGSLAVLDIRKDSSMSLSAPTTGLTAGILMFQDRSVSIPTRFEISSNDASTLLGTIYLPRGNVLLGGDKPVAQNSAYTIIIANKIQATAGPVLVLNSNYSGSTVPTPEGVGPLSNTVALQR